MKGRSANRLLQGIGLFVEEEFNSPGGGGGHGEVLIEKMRFT